MAVAIFDTLARDRGLVCEVESAGVSAFLGGLMDPKASAALDEIGIYTGGHQSRQIDREMLEDADLVFVMSPRHMEELRQRFGCLRDKVHLLTAYATGNPGADGIPDPHGQAMIAYRASVRQIFECVERVLDHLASD